MSFKDFGLDERLKQALSTLGFDQPTLIQEKSIPLALNEKKDIVARARTGSGKTGAYLIPILHNLLSQPSKTTRALLVVPSRELADQVSKVLSGLTSFSGRSITYANIAQQVPEKVKASLLADSPNVVVATPSSARAQIEAGSIDPQNIEFLVFDEADLLISYGFEDDLEAIRKLVVSQPQTWLMSATLSDEVNQLKEWFCRMPVTLKLEETASKDQLKQYYVNTTEFDKFLLAYVIFKLNLIKGKTLIFVNDIERCYRLKLFFEQFGIKSSVLNAELPVASRLHIVEQFNNHVFNILIATDEAQTVAPSQAENEDANANGTNENPNHKDESSKTDKSKSKRSRKDSEYGVSRGVDFRNVACVVNFDLPTSSRVYTHRIGRTARSHKTGMALSFVIPKEEFGKHKIASINTAKRDDKVLAKIKYAQEQLGNELLPYQFDMNQIDSFRYRMHDAFRAVTRTAVREARVKELKHEMITSEKLQRHFEENPEDLLALRHDQELHPSRIQAELRRVPEYLLPASAKVTKPIYVSDYHKRSGKDRRGKKGAKGGKGGPKKRGKRDPLKSFGRK